MLLMVMSARKAKLESKCLGHFERGDFSGTIAAIASHKPVSPQLCLLESHCYRRLGQMEQFRQWLSRAEAEGLEADTIELSKDLFDIQLGNFKDTPARMVRELVRRETSAREAWYVVVQGLIAKGELAEAKRLIEDGGDGESEDSSSLREAERQFLLALVEHSQSNDIDAFERKLTNVIQLNPHYELAYLALAGRSMRSLDEQIEKALRLIQEAWQRFPNNRELKVSLAQIHRQLGNVDEARALLSSTKLSSHEPSQIELIELAQLALDAGDYAESIKLLGQTGLPKPEDLIDLVDMSFAQNVQGKASDSVALAERVSWGATAWALGGHTVEAAEVFEYSLDRVARTRRHTDLSVKQKLFPRDQAIADELQALLSPAYSPRYPTMDAVAHEKNFSDTPTISEGEILYQTHCQHCHGEDGGGDGSAARHLFPLPRNFRAEPMRMVSAANGLATNEDLIRTIREGLPGTSMPAFKSLSHEQLLLVVDVVRRWQREGLSDQYATHQAMLQNDGEALTSDSTTKLDWIEHRLLPSEALSLPQVLAIESGAHGFESTAGDVLEIGLSLFRQAGCQSCHVDSIDPSPDDLRRPSVLFDSLGRPIQARDLRRDAFRRGNSFAEIYRRLVLGIPGTPHPAIGGFNEHQLIVLVRFVAQLNFLEGEKKYQTNAERRRPRVPSSEDYK